MAQSQISRTLRDEAARARDSAILAQEHFDSRRALGRRVYAEFSFIDAIGRRQVSGCLHALATLAARDPDIVLQAPKSGASTSLRASSTRRPTALGFGENDHVVLDLLQRTAAPRSGEIRETADRGLAVTAVEAGNAHRNRRLPPVGLVTHQPAIARVLAFQAGRKACIPPLLPANVFLDGQFCLKS